MLKCYRIVTALILYAEHGKHSAVARLSVSASELVEEVVTGGSEIKDSALKGIVEATITDAGDAVQAASIVFMHSFLDNAALDYCKVTAALRPGDWEKYILEESVSINRLLKATADELVTTAVWEFMKRLANRSLLQKIAALHDICKPGSAKIIPDFTFVRSLI